MFSNLYIAETFIPYKMLFINLIIHKGFIKYTSVKSKEE